LGAIIDMPIHEFKALENCFRRPASLAQPGTSPGKGRRKAGKSLKGL